MKEDYPKFLITQLQEVETTKNIPLLYEEAKKFLDTHKWCQEIVRGWHDENFSILDKLGVFLFEIIPADDITDKYIWIVVGDLPSVYLDASFETGSETGREALECYCILMEEWIDNVIQGRSTEECFPVEAEPTDENAELLKKRIAFIKRELLMKES